MVKAELQEMGFSIQCKLIEDNFNGKEGNHKHLILISKDNQTFECTFTSGCGNRHYSNGQSIKFSMNYGRVTVYEVAERKMTKPNNPSLEDVLYGLLSDSQCVRNGESFKEFCDDLGYDTDSREAERIFNGCRDSYFGLQRLGADFDALDSIFQDY